MSTDDVQADTSAAAAIDPAAALALRLAAAAGLRRAELAALRWDDLAGDRLTVASSVARHPGEAGASVLVDAPTKTANRRVVRLDVDAIAAIEDLRRERSAISLYLFSFDENPPIAIADRLVVDPRPHGRRDRPEMASSRPEALVGDDRHQRWPRRPHRRLAPRSRQPGHDAARVRPRRRGGRRGGSRRPRSGPRFRRPVRPLLLRNEDPPAGALAHEEACRNLRAARRAARVAPGSTTRACTSSWAPITTRRLRNQVDKAVGKPYARSGTDGSEAAWGTGLEPLRRATFARMRPAVLPLVVVIVLAGAGCGDSSSSTGSTSTTTVAVVREVLATDPSPPGAPGRTLTLVRYTIAPGAKLTPHVHPGVQVANIQAGTLTYTVVSGTAIVQRDAAIGGATEPVSGPATLELNAGDTVTETGDMVHFGANATSRPVVILASLLTESGRDLAVVVTTTTTSPG